jgi:hypothetical protein
MSSSEELDPETESDTVDNEEVCQYKSNTLTKSHQIQIEVIVKTNFSMICRSCILQSH